MTSIVKTRSEFMKDRMIDPQKEVVYWTEYVIRHKGATHLRSPLNDLPWYVVLIKSILV